MKEACAFSATTAPGEVPSQLLYNNKVRERKVIDIQGKFWRANYLVKSQSAVLDLLNQRISYNIWI